MSFTASTIPIGILLLYLCHLSKGQLLPVALFASVFQASSMVNFGSNIGVQPMFLMLLIAMVKTFALPGTNPLPQRYPKRWTTNILFAFVAYSVVSAFVNPFVFEGVPIIHPRFDVVAVPLAWETGHLNQIFYLLICFACFLGVAYKTSPAEIAKSVNWYVAGCVFAAVVAIYQLVALKVGLPFPETILNTSPTYSVFRAYDIGDFTRVNSTFPEAAAAAGSMVVGLAVVMWRISCGGFTWQNFTFGSVILTGVLITMSSTGYICLIFLFAICLLQFAWHWRSSFSYRVKKVFLIVPLAAALFVAFSFSGPRTSILSLIDTVLMTKADSESYRQRSMFNEVALNTGAQSNWFGVGFGVSRASSVIPTIIANDGVPGLILSAIFVGFLYAPVFGTRVRLHPERQAILVALAANLLTMVVSAPEMTTPLLWFLLGAAAKAGGSYAVEDFGVKTTSPFVEVPAHS